MVDTGIVRRIDDLGRIIIPRELRTTRKLCEGDPMKFSVNGKQIILEKYEPEPEVFDKGRFAAKWLKEHEKDIDKARARFTIYGDKTTCEAIYCNGWRIGEAVKAPKDPYDANIGMVIAFCRAVGYHIPKELYDQF